MTTHLLAAALAVLVAGATRAPAGGPHALAGAVRAGRPRAAESVGEVTVVLGLRDPAGLDAAVAAQQDPRSPTAGRWLDATAIADRFGPRRDGYERVRRWLTDHGLRVTHDSPYRVAVSATGAVADVEAAFGTSLVLYRVGGRTYRVPASAPVLPAELGVRGVIGLDDLPAFHPLVRLATGRTALAPADFATVYGTGALAARGITGAGRSIAVVARTDFRDADVASFGQLFGAPAPRPPHRLVPGANPGISLDSQEVAEVLLDTEWAGALAPQADVTVVIAVPGSAKGGDIPDALRTAVERRTADVVTMSFGLCEPDTHVATTQLFDTLYAIANAQGQTVLVSAGDDGATDCGGGDVSLAVNALAGSPHVVAVGGTSLDPLFDPTGAATGYGSERPWHDADGAGGGGLSVRFARPGFQLGLGFDGRAVPDVSLAASPMTPGYVIVQGTPRIVGGTSASTPALASVLALLNEARQVHGLGQLLPALYRLGAAQVGGTHAAVFHDVATGTNGGYPAHAGFDLATGWGTPIVDALADGLADVPAGPCDRLLDCLVPARGSRRRACFAEWLVDAATLARTSPRAGYPVPAPLPAQTCRDGNAACDADRGVDGTCTIPVALCLAVADARARDARGRLRCEPSPVRAVRLRTPGAGVSVPAVANDRDALVAAIAALPEPPTLRDACTATVPVSVPAGTSVTLAARAEGRGGATARVKLTCTR